MGHMYVAHFSFVILRKNICESLVSSKFICFIRHETNEVGMKQSQSFPRRH